DEEMMKLYRKVVLKDPTAENFVSLNSLVAPKPAAQEHVGEEVLGDQSIGTNKVLAAAGPIRRPFLRVKCEVCAGIWWPPVCSRSVPRVENATARESISGQP